MQLRLFFVLVSVCLAPLLSVAQVPADSVWLFGGNAQLNFSQATFINWSAGGENTIAATGQLDLFLLNNGEKHVWRNDLRMAFGQIKTGDQLRKSDDVLQFVSSYKRAINKQLNYNVTLDARTQFAKGYKYPNDSVAISTFMAPAFAVLSTGVEYHWKSYLSFYLAPVAGKLTYVRSTAGILPENYGVAPGEQLRAELGATFRMSVNKTIMENVTLISDLELFSNYLNEPQNIDINWLFKLNMKVNKYIAAALTTQLLYDHDILIPKVNSIGEEYLGRGTQFREVLNIGLTYTF